MTEYLDRYPTMHEYAEGKRINPKLTDLISRADAIDAVAEEWLSEASAESPYVNEDDIGAYRTLAENLFKDVPSAEANWIPVSERLPDNKTYVLTTIQVGGRQPHARSGFYHDGFFHNDNGDTWRATDKEVIAWTPLPKPYREESEVEE